MRIALVNPANQSVAYYDSGHSCVHLGLGYIASALENNGYKVDIFECVLHNIDSKKLIDILIKGDYDAIGFTTYYFNIMQVYRIALKVKKVKNVFVFVGGIFSSMNYNDILQKNYIDCCVLGEGEETVVELMHCVNERGDIHTVDGVAFCEENQIVITNKRNGIENLDKICFPKRVYFFKNVMTSMIASRGCNGNCSFCGITDYYSKYTTRRVRVRTPKNVVDEMEFLKVHNGVEYIYFQDENLFCTNLTYKNWIMDFCDEIKKRQLKIKFYAYARADDLIKYKKEVQDLKEAGLDCLFIGIESFVERQLNLYEKRILPEVNRQAILLSKDLHLNLNIGFILFDPYVTMEEIKTNIQNLIDIKFYENCYFSQTPISCLEPLYPMPNTKFYNTLKEMDMYDDSVFHKYNFADETVQFLYCLIEEWRKVIYNKYIDIDSNFKQIDYFDNERYIKCIAKLRELLKVDIEFLRDIANIDFRQDNQYKDLYSSYCVKVNNV